MAPYTLTVPYFHTWCFFPGKNCLVQPHFLWGREGASWDLRWFISSQPRHVVFSPFLLRSTTLSASTRRPVSPLAQSRCLAQEEFEGRLWNFICWKDVAMSVFVSLCLLMCLQFSRDFFLIILTFNGIVISLSLVLDLDNFGLLMDKTFQKVVPPYILQQQPSQKMVTFPEKSWQWRHDVLDFYCRSEFMNPHRG